MSSLADGQSSCTQAPGPVEETPRGEKPLSNGHAKTTQDAPLLGVAMNLGLGDIAAGVRLALQIYDKGFVNENSAGWYPSLTTS